MLNFCLQILIPFVMKSKTDDLYADMYQDRHMYDTSNYDKNNALYSVKNMKVIGKMKDETKGVPIKEFVGLRPKMYSMTYDCKEKKTAKGTKKSEIKKLRHQNYKDVLLENKIHMTNMNQICSYNHHLFSISVNKIGLSPYDDKRYVLNNGSNTLAHGHYKTV